MVLEPDILRSSATGIRKGRVGLPALPGYEALGYRRLFALRPCFPLRSPSRLALDLDIVELNVHGLGLGLGDVVGKLQ